MAPARNQNPFVLLESLLEKQIQLARRDRYRDVEAFAEKTSSLLKEITENKPADTPDFRQKYNHILQLYKELELILSAEKQSVRQRQQKAGNVRKTMEVYRSNP